MTKALCIGAIATACVGLIIAVAGAQGLVIAAVCLWVYKHA